MKPRIKYDKKVNILSLRISNKKSTDSEVQDNLVVDYDKEGNIVNLDIMDVNIGEFSKVKEFARSGVVIGVRGLTKF